LQGVVTALQITDCVGCHDLIIDVIAGVTQTNQPVVTVVALL
jgi:hypothetical protein